MNLDSSASPQRTSFEQKSLPSTRFFSRSLLLLIYLPAFNSLCQPWLAMHKRALIADDESSARRKLRKLLAAHDHIDVIAEASDGQEAQDLIEQHQPDIALLDIEMPVMGGIELAQNLHDEHLQLVFVTAFDQFAVQAFETQAALLISGQCCKVSLPMPACV